MVDLARPPPRRYCRSPSGRSADPRSISHTSQSGPGCRGGGGPGAPPEPDPADPLSGGHRGAAQSPKETGPLWKYELNDWGKVVTQKP